MLQFNRLADLLQKSLTNFGGDPCPTFQEEFGHLAVTGQTVFSLGQI